MKKMDVNQMGTIQGGVEMDWDCALAIGLAIGSGVAMAGSAATVGGAALGILLFYGSIIAIGPACV